MNPPRAKWTSTKITTIVEKMKSVHCHAPKGTARAVAVRQRMACRTKLRPL